MHHLYLNKKQLVFLASGLLVGALLATAGFFILRKTHRPQDVRSANRLSGYQFINPLLECGELETLDNAEIIALKKQIVALTDTYRAKGVIKDISVYFRDLNNGPWFGIDEKEVFMPGSLLKVPLMMAVLRRSEREPNFLAAKIMYASGDVAVPQFFTPSRKIEIGKIYTVRELVESMITYSDNNAALLLTQIMTPDELSDVYKTLGIDFSAEEGIYQMPVKTYASFFRILYNSSFLSYENSEYALKLLDQVEFAKGLRAGIPASMPFAHKFGERIIDGEKDTAQLHDCGIVYYPGRPYVACVMTRGDDFDQLKSVIQEISNTIYTKIDAHHR